MTFLRNVWYMVGWAADFAPGELVPFTLLNKPIVLFRGIDDGKLRALADRCPHKLAPLSLGRVEANEVRCMYHGMKFGDGGRCTEIPVQSTIPRSLCVETYAVEESDAAVWVWAGSPEAADRTLIPDFEGVDHPDWS